MRVEVTPNQQISWKIDRETDHPELPRANVGNTLAAANIQATLRDIHLKKADEAGQEITTLLNNIFPPAVAERILNALVLKQPFGMNVFGVYLGKGRRILYAFASDDEPMIPAVGRGLAQSLSSLEPPDAMKFVESYAAWPGDKENLKTPVYIALTYKNPRVHFPVKVAKKGGQISFHINAFENWGNGNTIPTDPYKYLLDRPEFQLFMMHQTGPDRNQEYDFMHAGEMIAYNTSEGDNNPGSLLLTAQPGNNSPLLICGYDVRGGKKTMLGNPSVAQFSHFLARLKHSPDTAPTLGIALNQQAQQKFIKAFKEAGLSY